MKRLKIFGYVAGGGIVLTAVVIALALSPTIQTWAVRRAASGQPGIKVDVSRVAAGLSAADVSDFLFEQDGMIVTAKGVSAKYSAWDFLTSRKLSADDVSISEVVVDLRNTARPAGGAAPAPATSPRTPATAAKPTPFDGLLKQLQLATDVRVGTLNAKGRALLPDDQTVAFELKGARIETGQSGKLDWTVDFSDSKLGAALRSLKTAGTLSVRITPDRRIDLVEIEGSAAALGPKIPADQFRLALKAEQPAVGGNENYSASLSIVRNGSTEALLKTSAAWIAAAREISGSWEVGIRSEQLATLLAGLGLPEIAATGAGKFSVKPDTSAAVASGSLRVRASQLAKLSPDLVPIGSVELTTGFDGALTDGVARLDQLDLKITAADGREFAEIGLLQKVSLGLKNQSITLANPGSDAARISVKSLPLAWAQSVMKPLAIDSGELSLTLAIEGEPDGSRVRIRTIDPVTLRDVTIRDARKKALIEKTTMKFSPALNYSSAKIIAHLAGFSITTPVGDSAAGNVSLELTNLKTKPVIAFASQLNAKVVTAHKPFLPVDTGPLDVAFANEGEHEGGTLRLTKSTVTIARTGGTLLAAHELLQPVDFEIKSQKLTFPSPGAAALRFRMGEIPLAWAETFLPKSKFSGVFAGGTFELTLRAIDDFSFANVEPVAFRGVTASFDGAPLVQALDLSAMIAGSMRGGKINYDLKRFEAKQGDGSLVTLVAAGEAVLGEKFSATAKGRIDADLPALTKQPALTRFATLNRGHVATSFDANIGDFTAAKLDLTAKGLVAKQGNQPLGDLVASVTATMKSDGTGTIDAPLTLTNGARKSDLAVNGTFGRGADKTTFVFGGKIFSANLVVDDFQALAALAPTPAPVPVSTPAPASRPAPTVVRAPRPASAPAPGNSTVHDTKPFWKGVNGKLELTLTRVLYGKDYVISAIRGGAVITDSRLSLENMSANFKDTPVTVGGGITFSPSQAKPYALTGAASVTNFDVGAFLSAANPSEKPSLESKVTLAAKLNGSGVNLDDLIQSVQGSVNLDGSKGVTRALSRSGGAGQALGLASTALSILGQARGSDTATALGQLTSYLNEMAFDRMTIRVERGADLNFRVTALEFISPDMRLTGNGGLTKTGAPNETIQSMPMKFEFQLAGKDRFAALLNRAGALSGTKDSKDYYLMSQSFTIGGTPAKPDSSALWRFLVSLGASKVVPAGFGDLLKGLR